MKNYSSCALTLLALLLFSCSTGGKHLEPVFLRKEIARALNVALDKAEEQGFKKDKSILHSVIIGSYFSSYENILKDYRYDMSQQEKGSVCKSDFFDSSKSFEENLKMIIDEGKKNAQEIEMGFGMYLEVEMSKYESDAISRASRGGLIFYLMVDINTSKLVGCREYRYK
ncbi:MAG TPA: hypothetical protein P5077_03700 [bacterium]|nr:hypothetical protein [bacterium]